MRRFLAAVFGSVAIASLTASGALADNGLHEGTFQADLVCPGQTYVQAQFHGWTIQVSQTTVYVVVTQANESGTVVLHNAAAAPPSQPLVICTYVGPISGNTWVNTGFFTGT